jgi:hypothetical protein
MKDAGKGNPCCLTWQELLSCEHLAIDSCWYTAHTSLGMMLISANTLAISVIGKDRPHRIIKISFRYMNVVFESKVMLLEFWEYMFGTLVTMRPKLCNSVDFKSTRSESLHTQSHSEVTL